MRAPGCGRKKKKKKWERITAVLALVLIAAAWWIGLHRMQGDWMPAVQAALPGAVRFESLGGELYAGYGPGEEQVPLGYVALGEGSGYGGPLRVAVGFNPGGEILGVEVAESRETPAYLERVEQAGLLEELLGRSAASPFQLEVDLDAVTSATMSSRGIAESVRDSSRAAAEVLHLEVPDPQRPPVQIGFPEVTLAALFGLGFLGRRRGFEKNGLVRWVSLVGGLVFLGFLFNKPLTLGYLNKFLMGFWPRWQTHLYWYLLIGGVLGVYLVDRQNPYCEWFCPFGAAQEVLGLVGGAKAVSAGRYRGFLTWLRRGVVLTAVVAALVYRSPGLTSYEVFGTLFSLVGSNLQYLLLALVLVTAIFVRRPWCAYLCPLRPVLAWVRTLRNWSVELWKNAAARRTQS